jgi:hypothetical protein
MRYTAHERIHNFSVWAAARATQRGFTSVPVLRAALEVSGVEVFARQPKNLHAFDSLHKERCRAICAYLESVGIGNVTYGRAAKLVNVYMKGMVVLPSMDSKAAGIVHPPIDRILLRSIAADTSVDEKHRAVCRRVNWTQLEEKEYFDLVGVLRAVNGGGPFWKLERYWSVVSG